MSEARTKHLPVKLKFRFVGDEDLRSADLEAPGEEFDQRLDELRSGDIQDLLIEIGLDWDALRSQPIDSALYVEVIAPFHGIHGSNHYSLHLQFLNFPDEVADLLEDGIASSRWKSFSFQGCNTSSRGWTKIFGAIKANAHLHSLSFRHCHLTDCDVLAELVDSLKSNTSIDELGLAGEKVSDVEASALASNESLDSLTLRGCKIKASCLRGIAAGLEQRRSPLRFLDLSLSIKLVPALVRDNDECATALSNLLQSNLLEARLRACSIGPRSSCTIAQGLKQRATPLESLDLTHNRVGDEGAQAFANILESGHFVERLYLKKCKIRLAGYEALRDALRVNHHLKGSPDCFQFFIDDIDQFNGVIAATDKEATQIMHVIDEITSLLELNNKGPLVAEVRKRGIFPRRLLTSVNSKLFPNALERVQRITGDARPVSALYTFIRECSHFFGGAEE